jgi:hypothetical protein
VPVTAILCWISYLLLRNRQARHARQGVAAQLIGPCFREDLCLDAVAALEDRVGIITRSIRAHER